MAYSNYRKSRDLSWQTLIDTNITNLPVKVSSICKKLGIPIISYEKGYEIIKAASLEKICSHNDGITFMGAIFYNQEGSMGRQRFAIPHELGHILMHTESKYNREPSPNDPFIEQEANIFASRLLAPACVLWGLGVTTAEEICQICDISLSSAKFRMQRLNALYKRKQIFIKERGRSCFLLSPLEKKVYEQFSDYIETNKL